LTLVPKKLLLKLPKKFPAANLCKITSGFNQNSKTTEVISKEMNAIQNAEFKMCQVVEKIYDYSEIIIEIATLRTIFNDFIKSIIQLCKPGKFQNPPLTGISSDKTQDCINHFELLAYIARNIFFCLLFDANIKNELCESLA
jgi:hypothetical protein